MHHVRECTTELSEHPKWFAIAPGMVQSHTYLHLMSEKAARSRFKFKTLIKTKEDQQDQLLLLGRIALLL